MPERLRAALREVALVAALFIAYKLGRLLAADHVAEATANAWRLWHLERHLGLPNEVAIQAAITPHPLVVRAANAYYAYVHFPATGALLLWAYLRRPEHYLWVRRCLAWLTATALAVHVLLPMAPPRMLSAIGMLDTAQIYGPSVYGPPSTDTLANQYAAMPSLHVGWAVVVALTMIAATRGRWRWLWLAHPVTTLGVVVVTGNHYWLDGVVALALLGLVLAVLRPVARTTVCPPSRRNEFAATARMRVPSARGHGTGGNRSGSPGSEEAADARRARCCGPASRG